MTGIRSEQHSPVINVPTGSAEVSAANAKARATLPTFWASYEASKPSETGHSLKVRFSNKTNDGGHIRMAEVKECGRPLLRTARQRASLSGRQEGWRSGRIQGGRQLRLDVHARWQDRWRRDHPGAAQILAEGGRRRPPRAPGNAVRQTQENGPRRSGQIPSGRLSDWLATMRRVG